MTKKQQQVAVGILGFVLLAGMVAFTYVTPVPTDFQYLVFRIVLSLAAAGAAALIPGFIEVNVSTYVKAGGAIAVFIVVFFYNPAALISITPPTPTPIPTSTISGQTPVISTSTFAVPTSIASTLVVPTSTPVTPTFNQSSSIQLLKAPIKDITPKTNFGIATEQELKVMQILEGTADDKASRVFDITVSNSSDTQLLLTTFKVKWRYQMGRLTAIDKGAALIPIAEYVIDVPVNPASEDQDVLEQPMYPSLAIAPGTIKNPTLVTIRLQLHYHFTEGSGDYHPNADWDIVFDLFSVSHTGQELQIFKEASWN